jgi:aspartokinase/homoserine dehydrogenase 1
MSPEQQQVSPSAEGDLGLSPRGASLETVLSFSIEAELTKDVVAFKFGGSSLLGAERLLHAAELVHDAAQSCPVAVVVSAMKGVTDQLLHLTQRLAQDRNGAARDLAEEIVNLHLVTLRDLELPPNEYQQVAKELQLLSRDLLHEVPSRGRAKVDGALFDRVCSFGERFAARLFAAALLAKGIAAVPVAASDFVLTCDNFRDARPDLGLTRQRGRQVLLPLLQAGIVPVVTGFIGATEDGRITTLGRNSSDFSGALIAHVVDAEELVIWTDVDGVYTADPRESNEAKLLHELSYDEAHTLAASGAKVLHPHVLPLAARTGMTVWIRNTFKPDARGTRIGSRLNGGAA